MSPGKVDPFFSVSNMQQLEKADKQIKSGQTISKTMAELEKMENELPSKTEKQKAFEELEGMIRSVPAIDYDRELATHRNEKNKK